MPIIEVRNISKRYKIGLQKNYLSLRETLSQIGKSFFKKSEEDFWALQDVRFSVEPGECLGIVGHNGAGKSTLLKILSRITPPTSGTIKMRGRVASLLEVGTGFHPELTGRENIFLNGSILGMTRQEIKSTFDEIVDFSGVEKFIDTPLKHYSSGMQLRLAFSVAAHLNPEILLIDEVLAVGDATFQKKCLGKMDEVSKSGRTIIFVSHDLGAVRNLCHRGLILENGKILQEGNIHEILHSYSTHSAIPTEKYYVKNKGLFLQSLKMIQGKKAEENLIFNLNLKVDNKNILQKNNLFIDIGIINPTGQFSLHLRTRDIFPNGLPFEEQKGELPVQFEIEHPNLLPNVYTFIIYIYSKSEDVLLWVENYSPFRIDSPRSIDYSDPLRSLTLPSFKIISI